MPGWIRVIAEDLRAVRANDPAAASSLEALLCHTPLHAILAHRLAHWMLRLHSLDAKRLIDGLEGAGFQLRDFTMEGRLEELERRVAESQLDGIAPALAAA